MAYIDAIAAAAVLGVHRATVGKYQVRGILLDTIKQGKQFLYDEAEVNNLRKSIKVRENLGSRVKELFVLWREGASSASLHYHSGRIPYDYLERAMELFEIERISMVPKHFSFNPHVLLVGEVAAWLKTSRN